MNAARPGAVGLRVGAHAGGRAKVLVGIGGSDLGPRAIYMALQGYKKAGRRVHFVSNVDPDDAAAVLPPPRTKWTRRVPHPVLIGHAASLSQVLKGVPDLKKTLVVVCSKSGGTLETLTNEQLVRDFFVKAVRATPARTPPPLSY